MSEEIKNQEIIDNACIDMLTETSAISLDCERKNMRRVFSRCGWAVFIATLSGYLLAVGLSRLSAMIESEWLNALLYNVNNYLYVNEVLIAISFLLGALALLGMPKKVPERKPVKVKRFMVLFCVCATIGAIGNLIGNIILTVWNLITGGSASNPLTDVVMNVSPLSMLICMAILAPILEEFFFRKLLIDRMYRYGELTAILVSAVAFGLFHQNFSQFFYAFGIGVVLGYLYCKTGSYRAVTLLHMVFNLFMGVIPAVLSRGVLGFAEKASALTEPSLDLMLPLVIEYALPLALYLLYMLLSGALNITGVVLICINAKKIRVGKSESALSVGERICAIVINVGVILASSLLAFLMFLSLLI